MVPEDRRHNIRPAGVTRVTTGPNRSPVGAGCGVDGAAGCGGAVASEGPG